MARLSILAVTALLIFAISPPSANPAQNAAPNRSGAGKPPAVRRRAMFTAVIAHATLANACLSSRARPQAVRGQSPPHQTSPSMPTITGERGSVPWATSCRNPERHQFGMPGRFRRNRQPAGARMPTAPATTASPSVAHIMSAARPNLRGWVALSRSRCGRGDSCRCRHAGEGFIEPAGERNGSQDQCSEHRFAHKVLFPNLVQKVRRSHPRNSQESSGVPSLRRLP
jgi:hypothetical protein